MAIDYAVVHIRRVLGVVEEQQLAVVLIDLAVRRNAIERRPRGNALLIQRLWIKPVTFTALVVSRERLARMHHYIGAGCILDAAMRSPARTG